MGRLVRISQSSEVTWSVMKQDASYSCLQEERLYEKWAKQLLVSLTLPEHLSETSAELVVYEVMRLHWGAPSPHQSQRFEPTPLKKFIYTLVQGNDNSTQPSNIALLHNKMTFKPITLII